MKLTGAVFGVDGVAVVTGGADLTARSGCVVHAAETLSGQRVTVGEQHVGVCVAVAMARPAPTPENHGVAVETRGAPVKARPCLITCICLRHRLFLSLLTQCFLCAYVLLCTFRSAVQRNPAYTDTASCRFSAHNPQQSYTDGQKSDGM